MYLGLELPYWYYKSLEIRKLWQQNRKLHSVDIFYHCLTWKNNDFLKGWSKWQCTKSVVCAFKVFSANILDFVIISTIPLFTKVDIGGRGLPFRAVTWPLFLIKRGKIWKNHNHTMTLHKFCKKSTLTFLCSNSYTKVNY